MMMVSPTVEGGLEREANTKDFEIQKALGAGAYGKVYRCRHKGNNRIYAVKQLSKKIVRM
jgi:serine/threonine protein kinase